MSQDVVARLEKLVDRLLGERRELQQRNQVLTEELDRLQADRHRIGSDLDKVLNKLDRLEGGAS